MKVSNRLGHYLVGIFIIFSFINHLSFRNQHFQEIDSDCIYFVIKAYPIEQDVLTNAFYPSPQSKTHRLKKFWTKLFTNAPIPLKSMAGVGLGTTYSPMTGFLYGLLYNSKDTIESFNSKALILTILVFHLCLLLLYLILNKLFKNPLLAVLGIVIFAFSYTNYNYAYHLGNYGWNTFCIVLWIYCMYNRAFSYKKLFILTAVLCWFSYFMVPMIFSMGIYSLYRFYKRQFSFKKLLSNHLIGLVIVCSLMISFYPPNQGARGVSHSIFEIHNLVYYFLLNGFSFLPYNGYIEVVQFIIIATLLLGGIYLFFKNKLLTKIQSSNFLFLFIFLITIVVLILVKQLNFLPSRHFLFLYPILLLLILLPIQHFIKNNNLLLLFNMLVFTLGLYSFHTEKKFLTKTHISQSDFRNNLSYKEMTDFFTFSYKTDLFEKIISNKTITDSVYYLKGTNFDFYRLHEAGQLDSVTFLKYQASLDSSVITNRYFIAYNPYKYSFNQPNNLYFQKIKKVKD